VLVVRLRGQSEMPTILTTRQRRQPASRRAPLVRPSAGANWGCGPQVGVSPSPGRDVLGFEDFLFDELEGKRALDASAVAREETG
jgi:hypothetical protein